MKQLDIYTDGSHLDKQNNGRLGIGGVLIDPTGPSMGTMLNKFSIELTPEYMNLSFGASKCSNPSAELVAVLYSLYEFKNMIGSSDIITVHADYIGVREWMTGKWKIREPYIVRIKNDIDTEIKKQGLQGRINFEWIRGHQKLGSTPNPDIYWNNYVDSLAKGKD